MTSEILASASEDDARGGVGGVFLAVTLIPAVGVAVALALLGLALSQEPRVERATPGRGAASCAGADAG